MASKTGRTLVGELEMTLRISAVAVCCSCASAPRFSVSAKRFSMSGTRGASLLYALRRLARTRLAFRISELALSPAPQAMQNLACEGFSCWHWGHFMRGPPSPDGLLVAPPGV